MRAFRITAKEMPRKQALKSYYTNDAGLELDDIELLKKIKNMIVVGKKSRKLKNLCKAA